MLTLLLAADHFPGLGCASKKIISCRLVFHKNGAIKQLGLIQTSQRKFKFLAFSVLSRLSTFYRWYLDLQTLLQIVLSIMPTQLALSAAFTKFGLKILLDLCNGCNGNTHLQLLIINYR